MPSATEKTPHILAIIGQTGAGKSTLGIQLAEYLQAPLWQEIPPSENEFLEPFYQALKEKQSGDDPYIEAAHQVQEKFLRAALKQGEEIRQSEAELIVWEMPPQGHFMYAYLQHKTGIMSEEEWQEYLAIYTEGVAALPTVTAFLVVTIDDLNEQLVRMGIREQEEKGREGESEAPDAYWNLQWQYQQKVIATHQIDRLGDQKTTQPIIEIKSDEIDLRTPEGIQAVIELLRAQVPEIARHLITKLAA